MAWSEPHARLEEYGHVNDRPLGRRNRSLRLTALVVVILLAGAGWLFVKLAGPPIPGTITIFTGPPGSPFEADGPRYQEILAEHGIEARLIATDGSVDNLERLLRSEGARVGFAESALIQLFQVEQASGAQEDQVAENLESLVSLGALYYEPFWAFALVDRNVEEEPDLDGLLVFPGREGSGTRALAEQLLATLGLDDVVISGSDRFKSMEEGVEAFLAGEFEAGFVMGKPRTPIIDRLLRHPAIEPISFRRAEAYDRQFQFVSALTLPEGAVDLARNIPDRDLKLVASSIQLVTTDDLSPVLVDVLLHAASEIHGEATLLSARGEFPKADPASLELNTAAERFYDVGPSRWRSMLPFWLATWVDRFALAAGTIAAIAFGLSLLLGLISKPFSLLLEQLYRRIVRVEKSLDDDPDRTSLLAELDSINSDSIDLWIPPMQRAPYLELRQNIADVRERVLALPEVPVGSDA